MIAQDQHIAVGAGEDGLRRDAGFDRRILVLYEHLVLAVHRHEILRFDQLQHQLLFFLGGVTGRVQVVEHGLGQYVGPCAEELVDRPD